MTMKPDFAEEQIGQPSAPGEHPADVALGATSTRPLPAMADVAESPTDEQDDPAASDPGATTLRGVLQPPPSTSRPRRTLAAAISRPREQAEPLATPAPATPPPPQDEPRRISQPYPTPALGVHVPLPTPILPPNTEPPVSTQLPPAPEGVADEIDDWSIAEQETVQLAPRLNRRTRPRYLETGEQPSWPPRTASDPAARTPPPAPPAAAYERPERPSYPVPPAQRPSPYPQQAAVPGAREQRLRELRRTRSAHDQGNRVTADGLPVADAVRQWWNDMRPGLERALHYQREARASGIYPLPAVAETRGGRLGDAFGRLAASARDFTERAHAVASPALKRLHDRAENAAQALVDRIEGTAGRQQQPFLGPGRVAIFFRPGVTFGQAQRLLAASHIHKMRIIPHKHGFLTQVPPGAEADVAERLRQHPYVRDVRYIPYSPEMADDD